MEGSIKKIRDGTDYILPITVAQAVYVDETTTLATHLETLGSGDGHTNQVYLDKISEIGGAFAYNGATIGGSGGSSTNLITGGIVKFSVDFINKTISFTTWDLLTSKQTFTLNAGTNTFSTEMGTTTIYYVCYKNNNIELVTVANIGAYTGYVIFVIYQTNVYPLSYPLNLIGVRGGSIYSRRDLSIGEWTLIGDSITFGGSQSYVQEVYPVPIVTNLAVSGSRMSGATGMWTKISGVTATTELCTIMGGTNDQGGAVAIGSLLTVGSTFDTNTFLGAYQTLIEGLIAKKVTMKIILITPTRAWTDITGATERTGMKDYADAVKLIGQLYGLPVVDLYNELGLNKLTQAALLNDGLHPNGTGNRWISAMVIGAIRQYWMNTI